MFLTTKKQLSLSRFRVTICIHIDKCFLFTRRPSFLSKFNSNLLPFDNQVTQYWENISKNINVTEAKYCFFFHFSFACYLFGNQNIFYRTIQNAAKLTQNPRTFNMFSYIDGSRFCLASRARLTS